MNDFPALRLLFGAYLNLEWDQDYADPWEAVYDFIANEPIAVDVKSEVRGLLDNVGVDDEDLRRVVVGALRSGYRPEADGWTYADWLMELARRSP